MQRELFKVEHAICFISEKTTLPVVFNFFINERCKA